ncbi:MAG TPA: hypothetical protein VH496_08210 [Mycobacterium sp.]
MRLKKTAATTMMAAALGMGALGAAGAAQADDHWCPPWVPCHGPGQGPGVLPPPGHIGQITGVPPGHWPVKPGWVNHL